MDGSFKNHSVPLLNFSLLYFVLILPYCAQSVFLSPDIHRLIYNQCSNKTSPNHLSHSPLLTRLLQNFISQSSKSKFFETIVYDDDKASISGTYQCRKDLTTDECHNCVSKFPQLSKELCSNNNIYIIPSRIQLLGCYARYEEDGPEDENEAGIQVLHRSCSEYRVKSSQFEEMKSAAFFELESGVLSGNGFCEMNYGSFRLMAECAANLRGCDCGECVNNAVQICEEECGSSVSGEIYLDGCFISYEYYGDPGIAGQSFQDNGIGGRIPKLVAIVIGAAILSGVILCFFIRSFR